MIQPSRPHRRPTAPALMTLLLGLGVLAPPSSAQVAQFVDPSLAVGEVDGSITFFVQPTSAPSSAASVWYTTEASAAEEGIDYVFTEGQLHWETGDASQRSFQVPIVDDLSVESNEDFWVYLHSPENIGVGELTFLQIAIFDDDTVSDGPLARIDVLDAIADDQGNFTHLVPAGESFEVTVQLDRVPVTAYSVDWTSDFPPFGGTLVFDDVQQQVVQLGPVEVPPGETNVLGSFGLLDPGVSTTAKTPEDPFDELFFDITDSDASDLYVCVSCFIASMLQPTLYGLLCESGIAGSGLSKELPGLGRMIGVLTAYRDEVLATTAVGRAYTDLYEELSPGLSVALLQRPTFAYRVLRAQGPWISALQALVDGNGQWVDITAPMQADLSALLDEFEELADPTTASRLATERARLQLDSLEGLNMDEFQQQVETLGSVGTESSSWSGLKARW